MKSDEILAQGSLFILCLLFFLFIAEAQSGERAIVPGIEELYRLDRLAEFKKSLKVASVSSYDTTGGNNDGFDGLYSFVRREKDGLVLADLKGPGVIYRIWTPTPTDDIMEFYFDGEKEPRIKVKFRDLFLGQHPPFERPLVGYGAGGFYSYVPLPFEKSCRVFIRAEKVQFYQIIMPSIRKLWRSKASRSSRMRNSGITLRRRNSCSPPPAGTSVAMSLPGAVKLNQRHPR